jgi:large subunit ribosomal protein L13
MKTYAPKPSDIERRWYVIDADGAVLGRLASEVAKILRGKHKPIFAPHADTGDHVIVVNAGGVRVSGGKETKKFYYRHSGYPGGLRAIDYGRMLSQRPTLAVEKAVKGMLPKNSLGRRMFTKLSVYEGAEHPHQAQMPVTLGIGEIPPWTGLPHRETPETVAPRDPAKRRGPAGAAAEKKKIEPPAARPRSRRASGTAETGSTGKRSASRSRATATTKAGPAEKAPAKKARATKETAGARSTSARSRAKKDQKES